MPSLGFVASILLILGGLNLGLEPIIDKFWIADLTDNGDATNVIYLLIGVAAIVAIPAARGRG